MSGHGKLVPKSFVSMFKSPCIKVAFSIPFLPALRQASVTASCTSSKTYTCVTLYERKNQYQNCPEICIVIQNMFSRFWNLSILDYKQNKDYRRDQESLHCHHYSIHVAFPRTNIAPRHAITSLKMQWKPQVKNRKSWLKNLSQEKSTDKKSVSVVWKLNNCAYNRKNKKDCWERYL